MPDDPLLNHRAGSRGSMYQGWRGFLAEILRWIQFPSAPQKLGDACTKAGERPLQGFWGEFDSHRLHMKTLYNINSLIFLEEKDIQLKKFFEDSIKEDVKSMLLEQNPQWKFFQIEAPSLIPVDLINKNYTNDDIFLQESKSPTETILALKPETTPSSYLYAEYLLDSNRVLPPFVVWQTSKSFRREQDQPLKHMRLKEFYQTEFQCFYAADTLNDYQEKLLEPLRNMFENLISSPTRIVESDRLPDYSLRTMDIEVWNEDKWMELCSISKRKDFTKKAIINAKNKVIEKDLLVLEIATSSDRILYNYLERIKNKNMRLDA